MTIAGVVKSFAVRRPDRLLAWFTLSRLLLVPVLIATFMVEPIVTTACLAIFMVADLYDGVLARRLRADGPRRRALDSIVDRIAIDACLVAACLAGALPLILLCGFLIRDVYLGAVCARVMSKRRVAIKADIVYQGLAFLFAVWAVTAPFVSPSLRTTFAALIFVAAIAVAADLTRSARVVLNAPPEVRDRVLAAQALRRSSGREGTQRARSTFAPVPATS